MKAAAVLLGPAGVGLVGFYQSLIQTASTVSALGVGTVGTRQIAAAHDADAVSRVRQALFWGSLVLAVLGSSLFWLSSGWIARLIMLEPQREGEVAWLSIGVGLMVAAGSQGALLTGLRRISDFARVQVISSLIAAALGTLSIKIWGHGGLLAMVLVAPLMTFLVGHVYVARLDRPISTRASLSAMAREWLSMMSLGIPFMVSGLVSTAGNLTIRSILQAEIGTEALGQFQAAWAIGMTYLSFILNAMAADYYPRLAAAINDREAACKFVNEQTEVALLLCGPVLLAMLALAPVVIRVLYSGEFGPAVDILRLQILGDIFKVMSWPLGFVLLAAGAGKTFILTETTGMSVFIATTMVLISLLGAKSTGVAFVALYIFYLPLVFFLSRRKIGFLWSRSVVRRALALIASAVSIMFLAMISDFLAAIVGVSLACGFVIFGAIRLTEELGHGTKIKNLAIAVRSAVNRRRTKY